MIPLGLIYLWLDWDFPPPTPPAEPLGHNFFPFPAPLPRGSRPCNFESILALTVAPGPVWSEFPIKLPDLAFFQASVCISYYGFPRVGLPAFFLSLEEYIAVTTYCWSVKSTDGYLDLNLMFNNGWFVYSFEIVCWLIAFIPLAPGWGLV